MVNAKGEPAGMSQLFVRWAIVWIPLLLPMLFVVSLSRTSTGIAFISALALLILWISAAAYAVVHPNRGMHGSLVGTHVVRR